MINSIPVIGWIISIIFSLSKSVPFWFIWTNLGIGAKFFYFLPEVYHRPGFFECAGLFICAGILNSTLVPKLASVSQSNGQRK